MIYSIFKEKIKFSKDEKLYRKRIIIGLFFGAIGDILVALPNAIAFLAGTLIFLVGHFYFILALRENLKSFNSFVAVACIGYGISVFVYFTTLGDLGIHYYTVLPYCLIIVQYLSFATNAWLEGGDFKAVIAAALFVFSDTCLAYNKFVHHVDQMWLIVITTYWLSQYLITLTARSN